eukprot:COSAG02_NODE_3182_length_7215_cov_20.148539_2_plen_323_part_00
MNRRTVLLQLDCSVGRGNHFYERNGYTYRTLDGADPFGPAEGPPNAGCQCTDDCCTDANDQQAQGNNYLPLPAGWELAPGGDASKSVIRSCGWSAQCITLGDSTTWGSYNSRIEWCNDVANDACFDDYCSHGTNDCTEPQEPQVLLARLDGMYTVTACHSRVLARCGNSPHVGDIHQTRCRTLPAIDGITITYNNNPHGNNEDRYDYGTRATFSCIGGNGDLYDPEGNRVPWHQPLTCLGLSYSYNDGGWDGAAPSYCGCVELPAVLSATISYSDGKRTGSVATYSCDSGDAPIGGDVTRTCVSPSRGWDGTAAVCRVRLPY